VEYALARRLETDHLILSCPSFLSTPNLFHPRQRSIPPHPHQGRLDRHLHDRFRDQELYFPRGRPQGSSSGVEARREVRGVGVRKGAEPVIQRVSRDGGFLFL
jgi:hypothetical protein